MEMEPFFKMMKQRMVKGAKKYGRETYLKKDFATHIRMAEEELCDLANYAFQMYHKLQILKQKLEKLEEW